MLSKCLPVRSKLPKRWDCRLSCLTCGVKSQNKGLRFLFSDWVYQNDQGIVETELLILRRKLSCEIY